MSAKTSQKHAPRKPSARPAQKRGTPGETGHLTREETTNLVLQAQEAFNYQTALGRIEPGTKFDAWRRDQVEDRVGKAGISKINRDDWKNVKALFLELSGREDEAFALLNATGVKSYRPVDGDDTWETCETYVFQIRQALENHAKAVATHPKGHLNTGWFLTAARQRTGKPTLNMDTLAERLDPETLSGLRDHLVSHINLREGRAVPERRAERVYPKPADPGEMDEPF